MRSIGGLVGLAIAGILLSCKSSPTDPVASMPDAIRAFLRADPSLVVRSTNLVLDDRTLDVAVFRVTYGEPQDCPSGCFYLDATGVRVGSRLGWTAQGVGSTPTPAVFVVAAEDSLRFTPRLLDDLKTADFYAFTELAFALACSPNTTVSLRTKILRENPNLAVPIYCPK
jgi:hypothetical protein